MTIARLNGRMQVCCDTCPASYPNTYEADAFDVMIADARTAGWSIRKAPATKPDRDTSDLFGRAPRIAGAAAKKPDPFIHACPTCAAPARPGLF